MFYLEEDQDVTLSPWTGDRSPCKHKRSNFPLLLGITSPPPPGPPKKKKNGDPRPSPNYRPHIEKGVFLIGFRKFLPNILPAAYIFSYTIMSYLKKLVGTKSVNTKQCSVALSLRIISHVFPSLPKLSPPLMLLCCPQQAWTFVPFSWALMAN